MALYLPENETTESAANKRRRTGRNVDADTFDSLQAQMEGSDTDNIAADDDGYAFDHIRDYDAFRRETNNEFVIRLSESGKSGAYFVPLTALNMLRKRRARVSCSLGLFVALTLRHSKEKRPRTILNSKANTGLASSSTSQARRSYQKMRSRDDRPKSCRCSVERWRSSRPPLHRDRCKAKRTVLLTPWQCICVVVVSY